MERSEGRYSTVESRASQTRQPKSPRGANHSDTISIGMTLSVTSWRNHKLRQVLNDLGLTPKSRKAPKGQGDEADPLDTFLKGA